MTRDFGPEILDEVHAVILQRQAADAQRLLCSFII